MATNTRPTKVPMDRNRKIALAAGALYIATFVTSIPALGLYHTALHDPSFLTGTGSTGSVAAGRLARDALRSHRHRHRRRALPDREACEQRPGRGLRCQPHARGGDDLRRHPQRLVDRDAALGRRRRHRRRHADRQLALAGRRARLDVPHGSRVHARPERHVPRHRAVPHAARASHHPDDRPDRRTASVPLLHRHDVRWMGAALPPGRRSWPSPSQRGSSRSACGCW